MGERSADAADPTLITQKVHIMSKPNKPAPKKINLDEPAAGREYDPGLTKREHFMLELTKAARIAYPEGDSNVVVGIAKRDMEEMVKALDGAA